MPSPASVRAPRSTNASPVLTAIADFQIELLLVVQLSDRTPDRKRGQHGAMRVVAVGDRSAEERHHRVADVLLDVPAEPLELRADAAEVRRLDAPQVLGIESGQMSVKSTRSTNRTVTTRRSSPPGRATAGSCVLHDQHSRASGGLFSPHCPQAGMS